jgi:hypothetical protein
MVPSLNLKIPELLLLYRLQTKRGFTEVNEGAGYDFGFR